MSDGLDLLPTPSPVAPDARRYDFGRNWSDLAERLDDRHLAQAAEDLNRLAGSVADCSFLDLGCGSGLHAAAALKLGARSVVALDYDPDSIRTTRAVLNRFAGPERWHCETADALRPETLPRQSFDIVYSWGVLHHTGDVWSALRNAAALVAPGGRLCVALYLKTPLCGAWRVEKRLYARNRWLRPVVKAGFVGAFLAARTIRYRDAHSYVRNYASRRGMEFMVDVDDWLGGYPYQSVVPNELESFVIALGFNAVARFNTEAGWGLFGTGCGEWRFERPPAG